MDLRNYQRECVASALGSLNEYQKVGVVMPTGSGKTVVFGKIVKERLASNPRARILIVSHLSLLVDQTINRLKTDFGISCGILQGKEIPGDENVVVTTMQSLAKEEKFHAWENKVRRLGGNLRKGHLDIDLIIIDECHRVGCDTYDAIFNLMPAVKVLGFTATPFRSNKLMSNFFDVIAYTISMQELIDQDFLVEPELKLIDFDVDDPSRLCTHLMHLYGSHRGQKGVVYLRTIQECLDFRNIFLGLGIKCEAVTSLLSGEKRDEILGGFRTNDTEILLTVDVLTAGVDFPSLQLLFMPYKVNSVTTYLQRVGRGLRPSYGKTKCTIYAGSFSPGVTKGFWEKVHKQILEQGRREYDDYLEEWEYSKETLNRQRYEWLERHIKFLKNIKEKGMDNIFNAARKKNFPKALLQDLLMNVPHNVYAGKALASEAQLKWVRQYLPEVPATLTKNEASGLIKSFKRMKGEIVPEQDIIQMGRFKGRQYDEVPQVYYHKLGQKNMRDPILVAYREHKRRIARKIELSKLNKIQGTPVV